MDRISIIQRQLSRARIIQSSYRQRNRLIHSDIASTSSSTPAFEELPRPTSNAILCDKKKHQLERKLLSSIREIHPLFDANTAILPHHYHFAESSALPKNKSVKIDSAVNDLVKTDNLLLFNSSRSQCAPKEIQPTGRANQTQLQHIANRLSITVPEFFNDVPDFSFYRKDVEFVNTLWGVTVRGVWAYWHLLVLMRWHAQLRCVAIKMEVVSIHTDLDNSIVHLRWRAIYVPITRMLKMRGVPLGDKEAINKRLSEVGQWRDGYSRFHVDENGEVYRHVLTDIIPGDKSAGRVHSLKAFISQKLGDIRANPIPT